MKFLGISGVVGAEAILGADGVADGFQVEYLERGKVRRKTVWVREFDWNSVGCDGRVHGFGRPVMYLRSNPWRRGEERRKAMLARVQAVLKGK